MPIITKASIAAVQLAGLTVTVGGIMAQLPEHFAISIIAGLAGGLLRWMADKSKIWPTGLATVLSGAIVAAFLWPVGDGALTWMLGELSMDEGTRVIAGACVAGLLGVSIPKTIIAVFEARRKKLEDFDA